MTSKSAMLESAEPSLQTPSVRNATDFRSSLRHRYRQYRAKVWSHLARVYYLVVSHAFDREMRAVAAGRARYYQEMATQGGNQAVLRRNVHRLEKGLIMRPFRAPFARDYILETAQAFASLVGGQGTGEADDVRWAADVLRSYFKAMGEQGGDIQEARVIYERALSAADEDLRVCAGQVPYPRGEAQAPLAYEQFQALCERRRSVRWYSDRPVPRELVDQALRAALQAPSACNRQSFNFRFFDDPQKVRAVANIPGGTKGYADTLPAIGAVIGRLRAYPEERDRHVIYIDGSLAAMSFMLALETVGLSSCAINWPDLAKNDDAIQRLLGLAPDERVIMLIGLGYADPQGLIPFSAKKSLNTVREWN